MRRATPRWLIVTVFSLLSIASACGSASAERWVVWDWRPSVFDGVHTPGVPDSIYFDFNGENLVLASPSYSWAYATIVDTYSLLFSGTWAVMGTVENDVLTPDPYASFVQTSVGSGTVVWAPGTPQGYTAPLLLGARFHGDGGATYPETGGSYTATLVLWEHKVECGQYQFDYLSRWTHAFDAVNNTVPEPSGLLALVCGLGSLGLPWRRRRCR